MIEANTKKQMINLNKHTHVDSCLLNLHVVVGLDFLSCFFLDFLSFFLC